MSISSPDQDTAQIQPLVRPGEHLLWVGRSDPAVRFARADLVLIPFSIFWCGFVTILEVTAITSDDSPLFFLWGLIFVAIGLYFLVGRFVVKARRKRRTVYALTDRRAIINAGSNVTDQPLQNTGTSINRRRSRNHLTVIFGSGITSMNGFNVYGNSGLEGLLGTSAPVGFYDVADADGLEAALNQIH